MSLRIDVRKNTPPMDERLHEALRRIIDETSSKILTEIRSRAPFRTGRLRSSFSRVIQDTSARITSSASYAMIVERGSRPHAIVAKDAKALHFFVGSKEVFARSVQHPGTRGRFFIAASIDAVKASIPGIARKHIEAIAKV